MARRPLTVYQRIARAAELGIGVRLSAEDAAELMHDDAFQQVAENDMCDACLDAGKPTWKCRHDGTGDSRR